jgi:methylmalonyl-CoA mutase
MKELYKANDRSQKLKYHIQTSGRSLHAQEIAFNDIRTTLAGVAGDPTTTAIQLAYKRV